ncbi:RHS repeat domain-containing protein [Micromonospora echinofusca]|uniref:RHS repeat domain-containing protein n=1 Tax=Micromonospora echinofusca TaxID=47858 RepID=UPI00378B3071
MKLWLPGRPTSGTANEEYVYGTDSRAAANYLHSKQLGPNGNQISNFEIYDGHLRLRQTQATAPDGKRVISDIRYDSRGLVVKESAFYNSASAPTSALVTFTDATVPTQRRYTYDGTEDLTHDALWSLNVEKWHTAITYDGDRVNVDPPTGGIPTTTIEDASGRTIAQRQYKGAGPAGDFDETTYAYDRLDRLTSVTDSAGNTWTHTYDRLNRQTQSTDPDAGTSTFGYDNNDQLTTTTDGRGEVLHHAYDSLGRPTELRDDNASGALRASWVYDTLAKGHPTSATRHHTSGAYVQQVTGYTDLYQPTGNTDTIPASQGLLGGTYTTGFGYHPNGTPATTDLPAKGGLPAETVTYNFTDQGYLAGVTGLDTYLASAQYYWHGATKQQTLGSGTTRARLTTTLDDATGRLTKSEVHTENQTTPDTWVEKLTEQYTHDPAGNVTSITETNGTTTVANQCFGYDYLQRLTEAWTTSTATCQTTPTQSIVGGADAYWHSYTYDKTGNRLTDTRHTATGDTTRDYTYPTAGSTRPHTLTSVTTRGGGPSSTYTYDNGGYLSTRTSTSKPNQTLTFDAEGNLTSLANGTTTHTYIYDTTGNRLIADNPGTKKTLYLGDTEYHLSHTTGQVTATRYYLNAVRTTTNGLTWMTANHHGTNQLAIDATALTTTRRRLTPFGEDRGAPPATWPDDKGFVGGTNDPTGYTHLGAREYDPVTGRFISVDPLINYGDPQMLNGYAYANNSPVTYTDPDGQMRYSQAPGGGGIAGGARGGSRIPQRTGANGGASSARGGTYRGPNPRQEAREMRQIKQDARAKRKPSGGQNSRKGNSKGSTSRNSQSTSRGTKGKSGSSKSKGGSKSRGTKSKGGSSKSKSGSRGRDGSRGKTSGRSKSSNSRKPPSKGKGASPGRTEKDRDGDKQRDNATQDALAGKERADRIADGYGTGLKDMGDAATSAKVIIEGAKVQFNTVSRVPTHHPAVSSLPAEGMDTVGWVIGPAALIHTILRLFRGMRR